MAGVDGFWRMWLGFPVVIVSLGRERITGSWFWWDVFLFPTVGSDEVMGLGLWFGCDFGGLFFFFCFLVVMRLWVRVCDFGGWGLWLWEMVAVAVVVIVVAVGWCFFWFVCVCVWWWWLAVSCECGYGYGFAWIEKKVVRLFRERETQIWRERKKHRERIKIIIFKWSWKKIELLMFGIL